MADRTLALLGDSILDNEPYATPEPDTTAHLTELLPDWSVSRVAQDGAVMSSIAYQLREIRGKPDVAVLSVGGNDAIEHLGLLDMRATGSSEVIGRLLEVADDFARRYETVARSVAGRAARTILCTIYEVPLEPARFADLARVPLALLNDRIIRIAAASGLDVLELRSVCTEPSDFVLQIEPSGRGAAKIASAIAQAVDTEGLSGVARLFAQSRSAFRSSRGGTRLAPESGS